MRIKIFIFFITAFVLISCESSQQNLPAIQTEIPSPLPSLIPSKTLIPTKTVTITKTATLQPATLDPTMVFTPTLMFSPYPTKQVVLAYGNEGGFGEFNDILGRTSREWLVLYSDGQLIIAKDHNFYEKVLSPSEMEHLLLQITNMGFYALETNQHHDETDKLYDFGGQYQIIYDGPIYYLSVNGIRPRTLCYYGPYQDFLIPEAKELVRFIRNYVPDSMTLYKPDRVLLAIYRGANPSLTDQQPISFSWPSDLPALETPDEKFMHLEGESAVEISSFFNQSPSANFLDEKGNGYTVSIHIVLPHVNLLQAQEWVCSQ